MDTNLSRNALQKRGHLLVQKVYRIIYFMRFLETGVCSDLGNPHCPEGCPPILTSFTLFVVFLPLPSNSHLSASLHSFAKPHLASNVKKCHRRKASQGGPSTAVCDLHLKKCHKTSREKYLLRLKDWTPPAHLMHWYFAWRRNWKHLLFIPQTKGWKFLDISYAARDQAKPVLLFPACKLCCHCLL